MGTVRYTVIDGEIIAEKRNGVRKQYVPDPLGSTVALLDNTQTQTDTFTYWPYGEVASRTGTTPTPFQYVGTAGYRQDSASKTYVRARYLDTSKGRWLTVDPIGFRGRDWNLFRYVKSAPISFIDPSGLNWCCWHVFGHCVGTCCQSDDFCNQKPRPLPGTPAPPPWTPPISIGVPPILLPPSLPPIGTPIPMASCQIVCHTTLCIGILQYVGILCDALCDRVCNPVCAVRSTAQPCHTLPYDDCFTCCENTLQSGMASDLCVQGCK
jgi:RHS repeat-associated protein